MFECSSLALYERFERKQGLSSLLCLKSFTSSCRYIQELFASAKVNRGFKIIQQIVYTMWSDGHGYAGIQQFNTLMNIPKPMTVKTISKNFEKW